MNFDRRQFLALAGLSVLGFGVRPVLGDTVQHWSDCAANSEPAYPAGPCDCFHVGARIERIDTGAKGVVVETTERGFRCETFDGKWDYCVPFADFKNWRKVRARG